MRTEDLPAHLNRSLSLAGRLTVWCGCTTLGLAIAAAVILYGGLSRELRRATDEVLTERIQILRGLLLAGASAEAYVRWEVESQWKSLEHPQVFLRVLDAQQRVVVETRQLAPLLPVAAFPAPAGPQQEPSRSLSAGGPTGRVFQMMAAQAVGPRPEERYVIQAAFDRSSEGRVLNSFKLMLVLVGGGTTLAGLGLGYHITKGGLWPLAEIVESTRRICTSTLRERVRSRGFPPELAALADNINDMLERLEESFARVSRFSTDIAHELRTPLNNLRGEAEVALSKSRTPEEYREVLVSSLDEYASFSKTIDRLLFIAQAERADNALHRERVHVAAEFRRISDYYEPLVAEKLLSLRLRCSEHLLLEVDRELFRRAVNNLVANAIAFTPGPGTISLEAERQGEAVAVRVLDTGTGISATDLPHVFDRFDHVKRTRKTHGGGTGLGLGIVKAVMDLHGGSVEIASHPGTGTSVTLIFPK